MNSVPHPRFILPSITMYVRCRYTYLNFWVVHCVGWVWGISLLSFGWGSLRPLYARHLQHVCPASVASNFLVVIWWLSLLPLVVVVCNFLISLLNCRDTSPVVRKRKYGRRVPRSLHCIVLELLSSWCWNLSVI